MIPVFSAWESPYALYPASQKFPDFAFEGHAHTANPAALCLLVLSELGYRVTLCYFVLRMAQIFFFF